MGNRASPSRPIDLRRRRRIAVLVGVPIALLVGVVGWRLMSRPPVQAPLVRTSPASERAPGEPAPRPTAVITFAEGCLTSECHTKLRNAPHIHAPIAAARCDTCHAADVGGHRYPLVRDKQTLCSSCHEAGRDAVVQHKAMSDDGCLACHDPHTGTSASLLIASSVQATCQKCHPVTDGHTQHEPYAKGRCDLCHEPHGSTSTALLRGGTATEHCATCHEPVTTRLASAAHTHADVKGSCLACHRPHASDWKGLLNADPRAGCESCHEEVSKTVATAVVSHDAVLKGDQCISCHEPHAADDPMMLLGDQSGVCLKCHSRNVTAHDGRTIPEIATALATAPVVHGAVASGNCAACHSVHGGNHARLLNQLNTDTLVGGFNIKNYALCFTCHDKALVLSESSAATQFRDGGRNLHKVHIQDKERSMSCSTCHTVHSGQLPRLIVNSVRYQGSDWNAPMGFELTPDGGRCSSGCHEPLQYSRAAGGVGKVNEGSAP